MPAGKVERVLVVGRPGSHVEAGLGVGDDDVHVGRDGIVRRPGGVHRQRHWSCRGERNVRADVAVLVERPIAGTAAARAEGESVAIEGLRSSEPES